MVIIKENNMPSPCLTCYLGKKNKGNPVCGACQKRIDRVREIDKQYPTGPTVESDNGYGKIDLSVFERKRS